jgi:NADP-dependent 3-hydroxy acid dehydrogenase YdfG
MLGLNPLHASGETNEAGHVVVIGGSSGIGLAAGRLAEDAGAEVTTAGRSQEKLTQAQQELGQVQTVVTDITGEGVTFQMKWR